MRRILMGVIKVGDTYYARKYVPENLQEAVARVLEKPKSRVSWLKRSLRTKDLREANIRAKPVLSEFDRILASAATSVRQTPPVKGLSEIEIARLAAYQYATMLEEDEQVRRDGTGSEELFQDITKQLGAEGVPFSTPFAVAEKPRFGLSDREMYKVQESVDWTLDAARKAAARGDISLIEEELEELLDVFRINLDRRSLAYRQLGTAVLKAYVRALEDVDRRNRGEGVDTPRLIEPKSDEPTGDDTLSAALRGWIKAKQPTPTTANEFDYAIRRFIELHGDIRLSHMKRNHVREFREALQMIPVRRKGTLQHARLPSLVEWSRAHAAAKRIGPATVNKLLGGVQAVTMWGRLNGLIPEDAPWSDPFARMRLDEEEPSREPWETPELQLLFTSKVFVSRFRPDGGRGEAAYWLPLLALYTGARLGELAPLSAADIRREEATGIVFIDIAENEARGTRLKTQSSRRVVPLHPELDKLGFLHLVEERRSADGHTAALFPLLTRGPRGGYAGQWSKWFGRYIRSIGVTNPDRVFHSFRHSFKDALRAAGVSEDINDALTGHSGGGVGRTYGAKSVVRRFGLKLLAAETAKAAYPVLDLSHLHPTDARAAVR